MFAAPFKVSPNTSNNKVFGDSNGFSDRRNGNDTGDLVSPNTSNNKVFGDSNGFSDRRNGNDTGDLD
jgi:hypothetical protein